MLFDIPESNREDKQSVAPTTTPVSPTPAVPPSLPVCEKPKKVTMTGAVAIFSAQESKRRGLGVGPWLANLARDEMHRAQNGRLYDVDDGALIDELARRFEVDSQQLRSVLEAP